MAGTWVTSEDGETSYRDWMAFCEDWVRHRLKQSYCEIQGGAWFERSTAPHTPPYLSGAQLDRMAHDICLEAWGQARDLRDLMLALVRRCGPMIPNWLFRPVSRGPPGREMSKPEVVTVQGLSDRVDARRNPGERGVHAGAGGGPRRCIPSAYGAG